MSNIQNDLSTTCTSKIIIQKPFCIQTDGDENNDDSTINEIFYVHNLFYLHFLSISSSSIRRETTSLGFSTSGRYVPPLITILWICQRYRAISSCFNNFINLSLGFSGETLIAYVDVNPTTILSRPQQPPGRVNLVKISY